MRILLCSKRDLTSVVILNDLLDRLHRIPQCEVHLLVAERTRKVETTEPDLIRVKALERDLPFQLLFPLIDGEAVESFGGAAAVEAALAAVDIPMAGADRSPPPSTERLLTLRQLVDRYGIVCQVLHSLTDDSVGPLTEAFVPDLILSVRFSFIFPKSLVAVPRLGVINVHPGGVPAYAGLYPHFHSMLAGEKTLGCTVHYVDDGIDSGAVLAAGEVPIVAGRSAFENNLASHLLGNQLAAEIILRLAGGETLRAVPQDKSQIRQHTYPTTAEFAAFRQKRHALVGTREYLHLLRRFGLFERISSDLSSLETLPESPGYERISTTQRG